MLWNHLHVLNLFGRFGRTLYYALKFSYRFTHALNIETVVEIMLDYRRTRDWFYAFRWVPSRFFRNLLKAPYTFKQEYTYLAHHKLQPEGFDDDNAMLNPKQYRMKF